MTKRMENFDNLRGLAIIAVVIIHVTASPAMDGDSGAIVLNQIARFGVPVFIFLSGWGLTIADSYGRSENYFDFLKKRLAKLLPSYLLWNIIYLLYYVFVQDETITLGEAGIGLLRGTNYPHLYFVPLIVLFYIAYPLLLRLGRSHLGLVLSFVVTLYSLVATWGITLQGFTRNHNPLNWLFYFVFGIWVAIYDGQMKVKLKPFWLLLFLGVSLGVVLFEPTELTEEILLTQTRPSVVFYSIMVILTAIYFSIRSRRVRTGLNELSSHSYPIYLSHYLFIRIYQEWLPSLHPALASVLVLAFAYGLGRITNGMKEKIKQLT